MRTDDFDDVQPQDTDEPRPDKDLIDVDTGPEDFNEFDQPATAGGNSLGEIWRNNPLIKIAAIGIGVVVLVAGYMVFGGEGGDAPKSNVGRALQESEAPGGPTTQAYNDAINDVNNERVNEALSNPDISAIPIPTAGTEVPVTQPVEEEPPVVLEDPLNVYRGGEVQQPVNRQPTQPGQQQTNLGGQQPYPQPVGPMGPDPAAVDALAQAMGQQMQAILQKHQITGPQIMAVTSADYLKQNNPTPDTTPPLETVEEEVEEILIPAGTIVYAQTLTEANSDVPGPVLARISSGPLSGSRILGTFQTREEKLVLNFTTVVIKGVSYSIDGVALDPKTTLPAVATDVDHRYWQRFVWPAAARFIEGMGNAIANREQTNVSVNGSTVTSSKPDLNTKEELAAGFSDGVSNIADDLDEKGDNIQPLVKVHAGTPIGVLFLEPVIKTE